jgi:hypothetical protein
LRQIYERLSRRQGRAALLAADNELSELSPRLSAEGRQIAFELRLWAGLLLDSPEMAEGFGTAIEGLLDDVHRDHLGR